MNLIEMQPIDGKVLPAPAQQLLWNSGDELNLMLRPLPSNPSHPLYLDTGSSVRNRLGNKSINPQLHQMWIGRRRQPAASGILQSTPEEPIHQHLMPLVQDGSSLFCFS